MTRAAVADLRVESVLASLHPGFAAKARAFVSMKLPWQHVEHVGDLGPVWRPDPKALLVLGDLEVDGNVVVKTAAKSDDTFLVVLGSLRCRNLVVSTQASFVCAGNVTARGAIVCTAGDSVSVVGGKVDARLVASGAGAWLQIFDDEQLAATYLTGYVMVGRQPRRRVPAPELEKLVVREALDSREWDALDPADREGEAIADYLRVDGTAAERCLAAGKSILVE